MRRVSLCLFVALIAGCSGRVSLEGTITLDGQPLDKATIVLLPEKREGDPKGPRRASAFSDKDGRFRVKTSDDVGIFPGTYKVTVSKRIRPPGTPEPKTIREAMSHLPNMREVVPARYLTNKDTPLTIEVPESGDKNVKLELNSAGS